MNKINSEIKHEYTQNDWILGEAQPERAPGVYNQYMRTRMRVATKPKIQVVKSIPQDVPEVPVVAPEEEPMPNEIPQDPREIPEKPNEQPELPEDPPNPL